MYILVLYQPRPGLLHFNTNAASSHSVDSFSSFWKILNYFKTHNFFEDVVVFTLPDIEAWLGDFS